MIQHSWFWLGPFGFIIRIIGGHAPDEDYFEVTLPLSVQFERIDCRMSLTVLILCFAFTIHLNAEDWRDDDRFRAPGDGVVR